MGSLTRLSSVCSQCPFIDDCDDKRMEACAYISTPNIAASFTESIQSSITEPILRETITIMVNGKPSTVYKDEIEKQLYKNLYSGLGLKYGG